MHIDRLFRCFNGYAIFIAGQVSAQQLSGSILNLLSQAFQLADHLIDRTSGTMRW